MLSQYQEHLSSILNLTVAQIDVEDLKTCIETKQKSEEFEKLTVFVDEARQFYHLDSLTIIHPEKNGDKYEIMQVLSGLYPEERQGIGQREMAVPFLGDYITQYVSPEFAQSIYYEFQERTDIWFSKVKNDFGNNYDAAYVIRDSAGNSVALITASASLEEMLESFRAYARVTVLTILLLGVIFVVGLIEWIKRRVVKPLKVMGAEADEFVKKSREQKNPAVLIMENETVHKGDEMEDLANSLVEMSHNMKAYVEELIKSAVEVQAMKDEVTKANELAMRDSMTGVKSKAAYEQQKERLDLDIKSGDAEFGIAMIDINSLKHINDTYGHEKGDIYIKKMCTMICDSFTHSPVFRVGGDEFVAVLVHRDYKNRNKIVEDLKRRMNEQFAKTELEEWQRPMAAVGIAVYDKEKDTDSDTVFKRADEAMYENKKEMKACREA